MSTPHKPTSTTDTAAALAESLGRGHEQRDLRYKPIIVFCVVLVISVVVIQFAVTWMRDLMLAQDTKIDPTKVSSVAQTPISDGMVGTVPPPMPRLQPSPFHQSFDREDMEALRQKWVAELTTVGGFENEPGRAHLPVDRVMQMAVEKGLGSLKPKATTKPATESERVK